MILLIGVELRKPPMMPTDVVGVIAVGVDGRAVRSAKATVPFLARFTGQGVESGDGNPVDRQVQGSGASATLVCCGERDRKRSGLVGMPVMFPLVVLMDKPWGRELAPKLSGYGLY